MHPHHSKYYSSLRMKEKYVGDGEDCVPGLILGMLCKGCKSVREAWVE